MDEVNLLVFVEVMLGKRIEQFEAYKKLKPLVEAETGYLRYELLSNLVDENKFILVEKWASQLALDTHDNTDHMIAVDTHNFKFRARSARLQKASIVL